MPLFDKVFNIYAGAGKKDHGNPENLQLKC